LCSSLKGSENPSLFKAPLSSGLGISGTWYQEERRKEKRKKKEGFIENFFLPFRRSFLHPK